MKRTGIFLLLLVALQTLNFAQSAEIAGVWKMYESTFDGETMEVSVPLTFAEDGNILMGGKEGGSWAFNQAEGILTIQSDLLMDLEGACTVAFNNEEMHLTNPENTSSKLRRLSVQKELEYSNEIVGEWELKELDGKAMEEGRTLIIDYNKNGIFYQGGIILGTWKYTKGTNTIIQKPERSGMSEMEGEAKIFKLDTQTLMYELNGARIMFQKTKPTS